MDLKCLLYVIISRKYVLISNVAKVDSKNPCTEKNRNASHTTTKRENRSIHVSQSRIFS